MAGSKTTIRTTEQARLMRARRTVQPNRLASNALRRVRAMEMVEAKIRGLSLPAIGAQFGVSDDTVKREIKWAEKTGLVEHLEHTIIEELGPLAIQAAKAILGDYEHKQQARVAVETMKYVKSASEMQQKAELAEQHAEDDVWSYAMKRYAGEKAKQAARQPDRPTEFGETESDIEADFDVLDTGEVQPRLPLQETHDGSGNDAGRD